METQQPHIEWNAIILAPAVVFVLLLFFIIYVITAYRKRQLFHQREKEMMKKEFGAEIDRARLEMSELTMKRIATELHDNIGQSLTLAKMNMPVSNDPAADDARQLVQRALNDLRSLSRLLSSDFHLELGLEQAIRRELDMLSRGGMNCNLYHETIDTIVRQSDRTAEQEEVILFRCVQESLSNVVKYAQATQVDIRLTFCNDRCLKIEVADNGIGFSRSRVKQGLGLISMEQRMTMLGGSLQIHDNHPGTRLVFSATQTANM